MRKSQTNTTFILNKNWKKKFRWKLCEPCSDCPEQAGWEPVKQRERQSAGSVYSVQLTMLTIITILVMLLLARPGSTFSLVTRYTDTMCGATFTDRCPHLSKGGSKCRYM